MRDTFVVTVLTLCIMGVVMYIDFAIVRHEAIKECVRAGNRAEDCQYLYDKYIKAE